MKTLNFTLIFILLVPIGTLTHELGHLAAARYFGNSTQLHYASVTSNSATQDTFIKVMNAYSIDGDTWNPSQKEAYKLAVKNYILEKRAIILSGPLQTLLTGIIGFSILVFRRKFHLNGIFKVVDWIAVFLALFVSRFVFNSLHFFASGILGLSSKGDEDKLAALYQLNPLYIYAPLFIVSSIIIAFVVFKVIPKDNMKPFLLGGALGCSAGWILWMHLIGPVILP